VSGGRLFLGVDGGGTKTAFCLLDGDGRVRATAQAPSSYYFSEGIALVERVLRQGVAAVCEQAGLTTHDIDHAFVGLPSYGESSREVAALDAVPRAVLGHDRYAVDNDMVCGWAGSLGAQDGINVISGTGSMTYGERAGRRSRVGGWGELFGDEGSAYWIAVRGLSAFSRMSDGRLPAGPLLDVLRAHLDLTADLDLIEVVLGRWQGGRTEIAALCPLVVDAAERGDDSAAGILDDAARELAQLVDTTRRRLEFDRDDTVPVSYSGGVFAADRVRRAFSGELAALHGGYDLRRPLCPPVVGAALYAAKLSGTPVPDDALRRLGPTASGARPAGDDGPEPS
jgi:N-acetylglucosamine kinase-like BadF-type ATPase